MDAGKLFDLTGRIAVITGASRGIGAAVAQTLAASGAEVVLSSRKREACESIAEAIRAAGGRAHAYACHIGELAQIEALFQWLTSTFGGLDVLVNNAGTNPQYGAATATEPGAFQKTVDVNFRGTWFMTSHAARLMAERGGGSIVNIASVAGEHAHPDLGVYSATKAAIINLTRAFARECGPKGVRVNAVLPGLVNTKFAAVLQTPEIRDKVVRSIPLRRIAEPEDIAGAVLYFASDASAYATGAALRVDGGWTV
jgi:NAD(P)-dependent dehydrogenase (short-subunit alcohol dehydrogenase family)